MADDSENNWPKNNTPTKHLTHNNLKITDEKDITNHLAETFSQNPSAKYQSKSV